MHSDSREVTGRKTAPGRPMNSHFLPFWAVRDFLQFGAWEVPLDSSGKLSQGSAFPMYGPGKL